MSEEYGLTDDGYQEKPLSIILEEGFSLLHSIDPRVNTSKGTYTWQIMKVFASKHAEIDSIISDIISTINITNASGFALDFHGVEAGLFRKAGTRATCTVKCTGNANDFYIPVGSKFSTSKGIVYVTTEEALLPAIIGITKGTSCGSDDIPYPYSGVTSISWLNTTPTQSGTAYIENTDWTFVSGGINWDGCSSQPPTGSTYYVGLDSSEDVSVTIPVIAEEYGEDYRVSTGQLSVNTDGLSGVESITNEEDSLGGFNQESDPDYRNRLLRSSRVQMGYDRIAAIVAELPYVRASNVYQTTGVDESFPSSDWGESSTWTTFETFEMYGSDDVKYAQTFKPSEGILTMAEVSLYVKKSGDPPSLKVSLYYFNTDYSTTLSSTAIDSVTFTKEDVDPDKPTDWQEITPVLRFGGLDWTKTYMIVVENAESGADASDHWKIKYQSSGNGYSDGKMYKDGSEVNGGAADLAFKSRWGGASFNVVVAMEQGESFTDNKTEIENTVLDQEKKCFKPISIQSNVMEADTASINITCTIFIQEEADWDSVKTLARESINEYLQSLYPGQNVVFSQIEYAIMEVPGVTKIINCTIQKNSETVITKSTEEDILVSRNEIAEMGSPGTTFTRGV